MFILNFIRYLRGYVWFEVQGAFVERFLNLTARSHIAVWQGRKRGDTYTGCVAARDYHRLRTHAKKTGVRMRIVQKRGAPFQRRRYRKRTGLLVGLLLFFGFVFGMSQFIWRIEVQGNTRVDEVAILQALESLGITSGTARRRIDVREAERRMLLLVPDLSWVALNIDGSAIDVKVSESILPPPMIDPQLPCNVVAKEAGQILSMNVYDGQALVAIGDTVLPGDIIVSGITQDERHQSLFRHARADVVAQTVQTLEVSVPLAQTRYEAAGKVIRRGYLGIFGLEIPVFLPWNIPSPYRVNRAETPLRVFSFELPVHWLREEYVLMQEVPVTLSEAEAKQEALRELENLQTVRLQGAEILNKTLSGKLTGDHFELTAVYVCNQNIAVEKEIYTTPRE